MLAHHNSQLSAINIKPSSHVELYA